VAGLSGGRKMIAAVTAPAHPAMISSRRPTTTKA
jgi:hypothetical protein